MANDVIYGLNTQGKIEKMPIHHSIPGAECPIFKHKRGNRTREDPISPLLGWGRGAYLALTNFTVLAVMPFTLTLPK